MCTKDNYVILRRLKTCMTVYICSFAIVDGVKQCSMCLNKAVKEKLEEIEVSKPSPIHKPWKKSEESLFRHPLPLSQHDR